MTNSKEPINYIAIAREYLNKLPPVKDEDPDMGLSDKQLDILGRITSLTKRDGLVKSIFPDEWIPPCRVDASYPDPHLWFLIELNPNIKKRGNKRTEKDIRNLMETLGLPSSSVKSVYEDEGHDYGFDFDMEGMNWEALMTLREECKNMPVWKD